MFIPLGHSFKKEEDEGELGMKEPQPMRVIMASIQPQHRSSIFMPGVERR